MRNLFFIFLNVLLVAQAVTAQTESRFYAEANAKEVAVGEPIQISFIVENGKSSERFTPPDWTAAGFMLLRSSQSSNISIMNGETRASASYHYTVTPMEAGTLTVPSLSLKNGDGELHTEPIIIKALPNPDGLSPVAPREPGPPPQSEPKRKFKTIRM